MQFPEDDNGKMLQAMFDAGMDLTKSIEIDFFLVFESQRDAESALEAATALATDDEVELLYNEEISKWELTVSVKMLPEYNAIVAKETELNSFAGEFDGMSDGWGVLQHQEGDDDFIDE